jgi:hypothetical protein
MLVWANAGHLGLDLWEQLPAFFEAPVAVVRKMKHCAGTIVLCKAQLWVIEITNSIIVVTWAHDV